MSKSKQQLLKHSLYTFSIAVFSLLLVAYAYDLSHNETIEASSTKKGTQDMLVSIAKFLGVTGSIVVGVFATGVSLYYTISQFRKSA